MRVTGEKHGLETVVGRCFAFVGSDEVISIAALAHLAPEKPVPILGQSESGAARSRYVPDIRKAQQQIGLSVTVTLAEAIGRIALP